MLDTSNPTPLQVLSLAVYDGRILTGHITTDSNGQWRAVSADGEVLGLFNSWRAASDEVWRSYVGARA